MLHRRFGTGGEVGKTGEGDVAAIIPERNGRQKMSRRILSTYLGKLHKLSNNPRTISDGSFTMLMESLLRKDGEGKGDIEMLRANPIVVWMVPSELPAERKDWPWEGQEGKLVVLSGNQRYDALVEMGYEKIPDEWLAVGKYSDGNWWSPEHAERFILLANSPEGVSGETDYDKLVAKFNAECLKAVGMDFAQTPIDFQEKMAKPVEDEVDEGEHGEQDQELTDFIKRREDSRGMTDEMFDVGFYTVTVFETYNQKVEYLNFLKEKYGIEANREVFVNGFKMAEALGKKIEYSGLKFPRRKPIAALQEMAMDGTEYGWETNGSRTEEGEEVSDSDEPDDDFNQGIPA